MGRRRIVFLGKVGHGKTRLLNVLTNSDYTSSAAASSCTRGLQLALIPGSDVIIIDTPGFYSSEDVQGHLTAQVEAFAEPVNGVYIIVRFGAASEMAEVANRIMDFTGEEDIRVICTHIDTIEGEERRNAAKEVAMELSSLLEIPSENIAMVGKDTKSIEIKGFLCRTAHQPRKVRVADEQRSVAASLAVGARKFNQEIDRLDCILTEASRTLAKTDGLSQGSVKSFITKFLACKAKDSFEEACKDIMTRAKELLPAEQHIVAAKVHNAKQGRLNSFLAHHKQTSQGGGNSYYKRQSAHSHGICKSHGPPGYQSGYGKRRHGKSIWAGPDDIYAADQPQNQADKDFEAALCAFLVSYYQESGATENGEALGSERGLDVKSADRSWETSNTSRQIIGSFSVESKAQPRGTDESSWGAQEGAPTAFTDSNIDTDTSPCKAMLLSTDAITNNERRCSHWESELPLAAKTAKLSPKQHLMQSSSGGVDENTSYQKATGNAWRVEYQHPLTGCIASEGNAIVDHFSSISFDDGQWCSFSTGKFG